MISDHTERTPVAGGGPAGTAVRPETNNTRITATIRARPLILSASMGAGHDGVATELARRLTAAGVGADRVDRVDVLDLLPLRLGHALRGGYMAAMRHAPWLYGLIYRHLMCSARSPDAQPLVAVARGRLRRLIRDHGYTHVVSTFHLAAQMAGDLRLRGDLPTRSTVLITDFAAHRMWLHPGNDDYLCPDPRTAQTVAAATRRPANGHAPLVSPRFHRPPGDPQRARARIGLTDQRPMVLITAGSWGVGQVEQAARTIGERYVPVILCGHNHRLRARLTAARLGIALGWRTDLPDLMAAGHALIDNAAGLTCREAFAAGLPVVTYRPIPGHGRDGTRHMAEAGLAIAANTPADLIDALDTMAEPGQRRRLTARTARLFDQAPAEALVARCPDPAG
jgi:UDP-N-acetylglucosamine:LPS N-acetylglucosamine transferase